MGNTSSNATMKAHKHRGTHRHRGTHKHGDRTCTRRHRRTKYRHGTRTRFGRRYRGGTHSRLRHSTSANPDGIPLNSSPPYPLKIGSRKSKHRSESSLRDKLLRENAIKRRKEAEKEEKRAKSIAKDRKEGFVPVATKPGSRFTVADKKHKKYPIMESLAEE